jgi:hypothetical protein
MPRIIRSPRTAAAGIVAVLVLLVSVLVSAGSAQAAPLDDCAGTYRSQGATGDCVIVLQQALGVYPDGDFGPITHNAVVNFQNSHGLQPDGVVGPLTWRALGAGNGAPAPNPAPAPEPAPAPNPAPPSGPSDPVNPPPPGNTSSAPPAWPAAGIDDRGGGGVDCVIAVAAGAKGAIAPFWYNPRKSPDGTHVEAVAGLAFRGNCGGWVEFQLQTKKCPSWRSCYWDVIDSERYFGLPVNGALTSRVFSAPIRSGTHSYRMRVDFTGFTLESEESVGKGRDPGIIAPVPGTQADQSAAVKLTGF